MVKESEWGKEINTQIREGTKKYESENRSTVVMRARLKLTVLKSIRSR